MPVTDIASPMRQLILYGYEKYFNFFVDLIRKKKLPNNILFSGQGGLGKATLSYHLINFILSNEENSKYSLNNLSISQDNPSYKLLCNNIHPNFRLISNYSSQKEIRIEQIRDLISFINKSSYKSDLKIILIDNAENLNLNSSNALLKILEEHQNNTFFFIIHNNSCKISETIKSRCMEFKFFFSQHEKKKIFLNLMNQHKISYDIENLIDNLFFDSPGNLLNHLVTLDSEGNNSSKDTLDIIKFFMKKYNLDKNPDYLNYISLFIEKFYNDICLRKHDTLQNCLFNYIKILKLLNNMKKLNLNEKDTFLTVNDILTNEAK